jgi:hypothetical protein
MVDITCERALSLAREQAPALAAARVRARKAASQVEAAADWCFNPQLSASAGPRFRPGDTTVDPLLEAATGRVELAASHAALRWTRTARLSQSPLTQKERSSSGAH